MKKNIETTLYTEIKAIIEQARSSATKAVNFSMVLAYWQIGKRIVEEEQKGKAKADYGTKLLSQLSINLTKDFGKGYSQTNLKYFRQFYLTFRYAAKSHAVRDDSGTEVENLRNSHALRDELSWTHYRLLMKVENVSARNYYMNEAITQSWSSRALERQIETLSYERILSSKNKLQVKNAADKNDKKTFSSLDLIKDPYVLEFLQLQSNTDFYERDFETAIINKLQQFLLELGKGFAFVSRQKRITIDTDHFFIDLVLYNYILKCFVLIDLKLGKLTHQDVGQLDLYVRWYEENEKPAGDNPTIGLILCSEKNETIVKYSVLKNSKQLFASKYKLYLPSEDELKKELEAEILQYNLENKEQ